MKNAPVFIKKKLTVLDILDGWHIVKIMKHKRKMFANKFYDIKKRFDVEFKITKMAHIMINTNYEAIKVWAEHLNDKYGYDIECVQFTTNIKKYDIIFLDKKVFSLPQRAQENVVSVLRNAVHESSIIVLPTWNIESQMAEVIYDYLTETIKDKVKIHYHISKLNRFLEMAENYFNISKYGKDIEYYILIPREWIV
ncbi:hypothetical protein J7J90_02960 [Candidatus Micrarchaeota archaeon]|nr:hypothetical protein [Candidatus Micrarchaeota archaeon]